MARGSLRKHDDGRKSPYEARVDLGPDPTKEGARITRSKSFGTRTAAQKWITAQLTKADAGQAVGRSTQTVAQLMDHWLSTYPTLRGLRPTTIVGYRYVIEHFITPGIGAVRLSDLRPAYLEAWYARLLSEGTGSRNVNCCHKLLAQALDTACANRTIATNPARDVATKPKVVYKKMPAWSRDQARAFLDVAHQSRYGPMWIVSLQTGLRISELIGLRWSDIDWQKRTLTIAQAYVAPGERGRYAPEPGPTKTPAGNRIVHVSPRLLTLLQEHRTGQRASYVRRGLRPDEGLVFTTYRTGTPIRPQSARDDLSRLCKRAGVPAIGSHGLRRTYISVSLKSGADLKAVSVQAGHASTTVTVDVYQRIDDEQRADVATLLDQSFFDD